MWDCYCPWLKADSVQAMPRESSPYKWVNKDKPIIISDSTYNQWIKDDQWFKKMFQRTDSTLMKKEKKLCCENGTCCKRAPTRGEEKFLSLS
jgi:hypothetical protein